MSTLVVLGLLLAACASGTPAPVAEQTKPAGQEPTLSHTGEIGGYGELMDALRGAGAQVDPAGEVQPFSITCGS
ncbi:MAG TPA: hypothetical protein VJ436_14395 [Anaerolineales bacterium]|nr:hypothetical protein [Anaerolineales bacterium]